MSGIVGNYILALLVVALMLGGLYAVVRALGRGRVLTSSEKRLVSVVESTHLTANTTLHVIKVAGEYFLVGGGTGHLATLARLQTVEVEPWMEEQRRIFAAQTQPLMDVLRRLRKPSA